MAKTKTPKGPTMVYGTMMGKGAKHPPKGKKPKGCG